MMISGKKALESAEVVVEIVSNNKAVKIAYSVNSDVTIGIATLKHLICEMYSEIWRRKRKTAVIYERGGER